MVLKVHNRLVPSLQHVLIGPNSHFCGPILLQLSPLKRHFCFVDVVVGGDNGFDFSVKAIFVEMTWSSSSSSSLLSSSSSQSSLSSSSSSSLRMSLSSKKPRNVLMNSNPGFCSSYRWTRISDELKKFRFSPAVKRRARRRTTQTSHNQFQVARALIRFSYHRFNQ